MSEVIAQLGIGDEAQVVGFNKGDRHLREKLLSMGLTPGVAFRIVRVAPLGDPVEIEVRGFLLSLRKAEAALLKVERLPA